MKKRIISGIAAVVLTFSGAGTVFVNTAVPDFAVAASAATIADSGTCGYKATWTLDDEGTLTISGTGDMTNYFSTGKPPWTKYNSKIKKVIIEKGITRIGDFSFINCSNLTSVTIPKGIKYIGEKAFGYCNNLTTVTIPDGVTSIGECAFSNCKKLSSITIPDSVNYINSGAFSGCESLKSITIPNGVKNLWYGAFYGCKSLEQITLPDTLTSFGGNMFYGCASLKSITIPDSVTSIGGNAFSGCTSLTSVTIPDGVKEIQGSTFYNCTSLSSINIPDSVTKIGTNAFRNCSSLSSITIPDSVTNIDENAFLGCTNISSVTISDNVTSIGSYAFGFDDSGKKAENFKIICHKGTAAHNYAKKNNIDCELLIDKVNPEFTYVPGDYCVTLNWEPVENAERYAVAVNVNKEWKLIEKTTDTSYTLYGLKAYKRYGVAVAAMFNGEWYTNFSNAISVTPNPASPEYPSVTYTEYNNQFHQFKLTWNAVEGAEEYGIAVKVAGKWKVHTYTDKTVFTSPKLRKGSIHEIVICAKVNGEWDTTDLEKRSFKVVVQ